MSAAAATVNQPFVPATRRIDTTPALRIPFADPLKEDRPGIPGRAVWFSTLFLYTLSWTVAIFLVALIALWDRPRSSGYRCRCTPWTGILVAILYGVIGIGLTIFSFVVLREFQIAAIIRGTGFAYLGVVVTVTGIWLAVSSFMLGYRLLRCDTLRTLLRVHLPVSLAMTVVLYLFALVVPERRGIPVLGLAILVSASALISAWHLQQTTRVVHPGRRSETLLPRDASDENAVNADGFPPALRDRYEDLRFIGSGGSARVFRAKRKDDGRVVAVKVPKDADEETGRSFLQEIRVWEELDHQNILPVSAVNILPVPFVEMAYVGTSLEQLKKPLPPPQAAAMVMGIADGLAYAHRRGVIHRDLKPGNILLAGGTTPLVTDWGTSRSRASRITVPPGFSLSYAAPEQISPARYGATGSWTDIWQLGVILYELATGELPFCAEDPGVQGQAILDDPPDPPSRRNPAAVPLDGIVLRCLEKEPSRRFGSMEELHDALGRFVSTGGGTTG